MAENEKVKLIDSEKISEFFFNSDIYNEITNFLEKQAKLDELEFQKKYRLWKSIFKRIYGNDIDRSLFLKHSYFALILNLLVVRKLDAQGKESLKKFYQDHNLSELEYFFCPDLKKDVINQIHILLKDSRFAYHDLFQKLYQQVFFIITRHKLGEFYTPPELAKKMIDDSYEIGVRTLDPSCGSGGFLIELIIKILNSKVKENVKFDAIENIYGFDINLLATLTAKVNILLLLFEYYNAENDKLPKINIFLIDALFPDQNKKNLKVSLSKLYHSFDLVIGNPPWLTYKDIINKAYQIKIRTLSETLGIKPQSQYITHIELAAVFFYAIPLTFLKIGGSIFFVLTKSVLNGDHCYKFRAFSIFNKIEIWDFPNNYFFNVEHICLKAKYIGRSSEIPISEKYPIKTKIYDSTLELQRATTYSSLAFDEKGAKIILPEQDLKFLNTLSESQYRRKFFQGATLVPRALVFFKIDEENENYLQISSDPEVKKRAKKNWRYSFQNKKIESKFNFKAFLNSDLIPFCIKRFKCVFLPINENFEFDETFLRNNPRALEFYDELNKFYRENKRETSEINNLFSNLNYWNKLTKQINNKQYIVVYNASGSRLKSAVIDNEEKEIIICSENYYYSTDSQNEAHYLSAIFNSPILSKNIKLIKSSRHIHKRPFLFPIPEYDHDNEIHRRLAKKSQKYQSIVRDLVNNNPKITSEKVRTFIHHKLSKLDNMTKEIVFKI